METLPLDLQQQQKNHDHHNKKKKKTKKETLLSYWFQMKFHSRIAKKASTMHSSYRDSDLSSLHLPFSEHTQRLRRRCAISPSSSLRLFSHNGREAFIIEE